MNRDTLISIMPFILLGAFIIYNSYNFFTLDSRLQFMINHPVQVVQYAREVKTRLNEMHTMMPGLLAQPNLSYTQISKILTSQEEMQDKAIEKITTLYESNSALLASMQNTIKEIRILRRKIAHILIGNDNYQRSLNLSQELLTPQVKKLSSILDKIIESSSNYMEDLRRQSSIISKSSSIITLITGFLVACFFYYVIKRNRRITRKLEDNDQIFSQISQNVDEIFIVAANKQDFHYCTPNSKRIIGLKAANILAKPEILYSFLPSRAAKWLESNLQEAVSESTATESTMVADIGTQVLRLGIYPYQHNGVRRAIIAIEDNTETFRREEALETSLATAHAASVAKTSFLSHMSHEIRTPMNAIIGMTTIALSKLNNPARVEDCLLKISESSAHLLRLINDVLDMSKIENGKLSLNNEPFSLADSIRHLNDLIRPQATSRKLELEILQEGVDTEELIGDSLRLNQILLNILSNSLKFTPAGGTITMKIQQLARTESHVRLGFTLSDTGIGMNEEMLARLYKPFEQASSSTAIRYGGTGLGMSITFNLITMMGGSINVESEEGKGTKFHIELPFGYVATENAKPIGLPPLKILIIDDDPGTCEHAALLLDKMGMQTQWCTSGKEALKMIRQAADSGEPYNVCFVDWKMPEMDGAETASRIRQITGHDMLIIIITAYDWSPIEEKARASGVDDFLAKPFFASSLYNALMTSSKRLSSQQTENIQEQVKSPDFTGKRVLLVEDNNFNREIANEFLEMANVTVENAVNGKEAVELVANSSPAYYDLILMDVQMPVMDGYEATREIRALQRPDATSLPILAMTANAFSEDVNRAKESGMNDHIAKPIDIEILYGKLNEWLNKS